MKKNQIQINAAFKSALKTARADGTPLTQAKALKIALAAINAMVKEDGTPITLDSFQKDVVSAMFYPKAKLKEQILEAIFLAAGCSLDLTTKALLLPLFSPANLDKKLSALKEAPPVDWNAMLNENGEEDESTDEDHEEALEGEEEAPMHDDDPEVKETPRTVLEPKPVTVAKEPQAVTKKLAVAK